MLDLSDKEAIEKVFEGRRIDRCIHLAVLWGVGEGRIGPDPQINGGGAIVFRPELLNL